MIKKLISAVLAAALCFSGAMQLPAYAADDILAGKSTKTLRMLTFDEGATISEIRGKNSFDLNVGSGSVEVDAAGKSGQCAKFTSGAQNTSLADSNTAVNIWGTYSGQVLYEGYFKFADMNTTYKLMHVNARDTGSATRWVSGFTAAKKLGRLVLSGSQMSATKTLTLGQWYLLQEVIDTDAQTVYYYVDGALLGSGRLGYSITETLRVQVRADFSDTAGTMYFDSWRAAQIEDAPALAALTPVHSIGFDNADTVAAMRNADTAMFDYAGAIEVSADGADGQCLKFANSADTAAQLTIYEPYCGKIILDGSFKFDGTDTSYQIFHTEASTDSGKKWVSGFNVNGLTVSNMAGTATGTLEAGRWYRFQEVIDTDDGDVSYYIDGQWLASDSIGALTGITRTIVRVPASANAAAMYFDSYTASVGSIFDSMTREDALSERPDATQIEADYTADGVHPRLMATAADFAALREKIKTNPDKAMWYRWLILRADALLGAATLKYELRDGVRLMYVSSALEERMVTLGMAYQLTGDKKYADKAYTDLAAVADFADWHPEHHIDVGIMAAGYAIGYDWIYSALSGSQRTKLAVGARDNGFPDIIKSYASKNSAMTNAAYMQNNHNAMCNGGAVLLALAFYDTFPQRSSYILQNAVRGFEEMLVNYSDDGSWYEGSSYGAININYLSMAFSSMQNSLGGLYGLDTRTPGLKNAYSYIRNIESEVGNYNFADTDFSEQVSCAGGWIQQYFGEEPTRRLLRDGVISENSEQIALALLWNSGEQKSAAPRDMHYKNDDMELLLLRDTAAGEETFAGIIAGKTVYDHNHLDSGSFVFDSQGVRWAYDLGKDDYNLPGYEERVNGGRWKVFRTRAEAHNTLIINPDMNPDYKVGAEAWLENIGYSEDGALAVIDKSGLLGERAQSAKRAYLLTDGRKSLVVRDEVQVADTSDIYWLMYTRAGADINGSRVILTDSESPEKKLCVDFAASGDFDIIYEPAAPIDGTPIVAGQNENEDYYRLALKITASGDVDITVKLTPINISGSDISDYDKPISQYSLADTQPCGDMLGYAGGTDSYRTVKEWQNIAFDDGANISSEDTSMINTRDWYSVRTGMGYDWSMVTKLAGVKDGSSDTVVVKQMSDGNRVAELRAGYESKYDKLKNNAAVMHDSSYLKSSFGTGLIRYTVNVRFPDFNSQKKVLSQYYKDANGTGKWGYAMLVQPFGENGLLALTDAPEKYFALLEKDGWYNFELLVDVTAAKTYYYLDGKYVGERSIPGGITRQERAQLRVEYAEGETSRMIVDDFKIDNITQNDAELRLYVGEKTARAAESPNGSVILAEYKDDALVGARIFSSDKTAVFDSTLSGGQDTVRAFLWENMDPQCRSIDSAM